MKIIIDSHHLFENLNANEWRQLFSSIEKLVRFGQERTDFVSEDKLPSILSPRAATILLLRCPRRIATKVFNKYLEDYSGEDEQILKCAQDVCLYGVLHGDISWRKAANILATAYSKGIALYHYYSPLYVDRRTQTIPDDVAIEIASNPEKFPGILVNWAEQKCRENISKKIVPVSKVAAAERWFQRADDK